MIYIWKNFFDPQNMKKLPWNRANNSLVKYIKVGNKDLFSYLWSQYTVFPHIVAVATIQGSKPFFSTLESVKEFQIPYFLISIVAAATFFFFFFFFFFGSWSTATIQGRKLLISCLQIPEDNDWCAVCHDGGDTLYCCDRCPKVYHMYCFIPPLTEEPPDDWVCLN